MTTESLGRKQKENTKNKISKSMTGAKNPAYKNGERSYRRIAGAKDNDGSVIHHKNGNRKDNRRSNLEKISKQNRSKHDKMHKRERNFKK